jgi:hypothetical protein
MANDLWIPLSADATVVIGESDTHNLHEFKIGYNIK